VTKCRRRAASVRLGAADLTVTSGGVLVRHKEKEETTHGSGRRACKATAHDSGAASAWPRGAPGRPAKATKASCGAQRMSGPLGVHAAAFVLAAARGGNGGLQPGCAWAATSQRRGSEEVGRRVCCSVLQTSWRHRLRPARGSLWRGRLGVAHTPMRASGSAWPAALAMVADGLGWASIGRGWVGLAAAGSA
jgi:hypothetical protein